MKTEYTITNAKTGESATAVFEAKLVEADASVVLWDSSGTIIAILQPMGEYKIAAKSEDEPE